MKKNNNNNKRKIAIVNSNSFGKYFSIHLKKLKKIGKVKFFNFHKSICSKKLYFFLKNYDFIIAGVTPNFKNNFFKKCKKLKIISRHGIGYNNIDIHSANKNNIFVTKVSPDDERDAVAENTVALMLSLSRKIFCAANAVKKNKWNDRAKFLGFQLKNKIVGIIGHGNIGSRVGEILRNGFNMKILAYDPFISSKIKKKYKNRIKFVFSLNEIYKFSDFITLNSSLNKYNYRFLTIKDFSKMKKNVLIINTARGGLVKEKDVIFALKKKLISGYAADVVENEPITNKHYLLNNNNILITPHISAYTDYCLKKMGDKCVNDIERVSKNFLPYGLIIKNKKIKNIKNKDKCKKDKKC